MDVRAILHLALPLRQSWPANDQRRAEATKGATTCVPFRAHRRTNLTGRAANPNRATQAPEWHTSYIRALRSKRGLARPINSLQCGQSRRKLLERSVIQFGNFLRDHVVAVPKNVRCLG